MLGKGLLTFEGDDHGRVDAERGVRRFLFSLIVIAVLFGSPYAAWLLNRVMGPWGAGLGERDGSVSQVYSTRACRRPIRARVSRRPHCAIEPAGLAGRAERRRLPRAGGARLGRRGARLLPGAPRGGRVHGQ